jgi:hypothetical protein
MAMSVMLAALREMLIEHMVSPAHAGDVGPEKRAELVQAFHATIDAKVKEVILRSPADPLSKKKILFLALGPAAMIDDIEVVDGSGD